VPADHSGAAALSQALNAPLMSYVDSHDLWPKVPSYSIFPAKPFRSKISVFILI